MEAETGGGQRDGGNEGDGEIKINERDKDVGRRRVWLMGEGEGGGKLKLLGAQGDGGSEGDGEIRRTKRDKEEDNQAGVCAG